jgi:hypothetical protein
MNVLMKKQLSRWALAFSALTVGSALTAHADIIVITGVNNQGTDNVLLNPATNVTTVTGTVGPSNLLVNFTSESGSGLLNANPSGQATVSGGTVNVALTQLSFDLANDQTFTRAVFDINAATNGSAVIHVEGMNISGGFFEDDFTVDANGENFFTVTAINGQLMTSVELTGINGATFEDVRQVRIGGMVPAIPEPETYALMMAGLGAMGFVARRRKQGK